MTLVPILSLSGAPGVTTLACLVASTWPVQGSVLVVECDPSGGDLAARFGLTSTVGWRSLAAAVRRTGTTTPLDPHLQGLPGGLPVLIGAEEGTSPAADGPEAQVVRAGPGGDRGAGVVVVDLGRAPRDRTDTGGWLAAGDLSILVVRDDAAAALRVRDRATELLDRTDGRLGLVVVGGSTFRCRELAEFTGIAPLGDVAFDPESAAVASGASGAGRRLERSRLLASARRVGERVADRTGDGALREHPVEGTDDQVLGRTGVPTDDGPDVGPCRTCPPVGPWVVARAPPSMGRPDGRVADHHDPPSGSRGPGGRCSFRTLR